MFIATIAQLIIIWLVRHTASRFLECFAPWQQEAGSGHPKWCLMCQTPKVDWASAPSDNRNPTIKHVNNTGHTNIRSAAATVHNLNSRTTGGGCKSCTPAFFLNISVALRDFPLRFGVSLEPSKSDGMTLRFSK